MIRELEQLRRARVKRIACLLVVILCVVVNTLWVFDMWMKTKVQSFSDVLMSFTQTAPWVAPIAILAFVGSLYFRRRSEQFEARLHDGTDRRERPR
jgi:hypothetical protein